MYGLHWKCWRRWACTVISDEAGITVIGPPPGQLRGIERDMSAISDTSLTLAAIAPFANSPTIVHNIAHSRLQECDRIAAACTELTKLGVQVEERPDGFTVYPTEILRPAEIETYNDHRVAMSFALVGLARTRHRHPQSGLRRQNLPRLLAAPRTTLYNSLSEEQIMDHRRVLTVVPLWPWRRERSDRFW